MKKTIIMSCLFLISIINLQGQWYIKEYNVTDINFLSKGQLDKSLVKSKNELLTAGTIAGMGGVVFILFKLAHIGLIGTITGSGIMAGGVIAGIVCLERIGNIKSTINKNYPTVGSLSISPTIILNNYTRSCCSGFTLTFNF
ncbi:MAG: hypothetical protein EPN88_07210 [Bacteroidetes bacterium]|nr:MAG: hypothetical protein EPN88_07210 [Bacteroidota bacterium]